MAQLEQIAAAFDRDPWVGLNLMIQRSRLEQSRMNRWMGFLKAERDKVRAEIEQVQSKIRNTVCASTAP